MYLGIYVVATFLPLLEEWEDLCLLGRLQLGHLGLGTPVALGRCRSGGGRCWRLCEENMPSEPSDTYTSAEGVGDVVSWNAAPEGKLNGRPLAVRVQS